MSSKTPYYEAYEVLKHVYLEDSYVLDVTEENDSVEFEMELILTEDHNLYHLPKPTEQYCYKKGRLKFLSCSYVRLELSNKNPSTDANGEVDLGNIDSFEKVIETSFLQGDWGELAVICDKFEVEYDHGKVVSS